MRTVALLALLLACTPAQPGPGAAYRAFTQAVADRDADRAWGLLSSDTRAWLDARARVASTAAPGVVASGGEDLLLGTATREARPLASLVVLRASRDEAVVEAQEEGGARRQVELVREGGWRVRIPPPPGG